ncbi:MAG: sigma-70 family RNA polymerase sigma factor [Clostridia bacterium]|nr:sigma-70 family RNA polymerase sigma factor [Clostridia bacterium]
MKHTDGLLALGGELSSEEVIPTVETALVKDAIAGDKDAFSQLFRLTYRQMFYVARKILWQDEDIYDALQIAYTKAYKYMDRVNDPEKFVAWLSRIVLNAAKDVYTEVYQHSAEALDDEPAAPDTTEDTERRADIRDALQSLPVEQAEVLSLYYYDGLTLAEIAKLLNISMAAAYRRLGAAKKCLLKELEVRGIDRNVYGGGVFAAIAVAFRSAIGTDILSATVAQQMLDNVLTGKQTRLTGAAASLVMQKRNRAVLRIASMLLAFCLLVTTATTLLALWLSGSLTPPPATTSPFPEWIWTSTSTTASTTTTTPSPSSGETSGPSSSSETISTTTTGGSRSTNITASTTTTTNTATAPSGSSSSSTTTTTAYDREEFNGYVQDGVYINKYLGIKMTLPEDFEVHQDITVDAGENATAYHDIIIQKGNCHLGIYFYLDYSLRSSRAQRVTYMIGETEYFISSTGDQPIDSNNLPEDFSNLSFQHRLPNQYGPTIVVIYTGEPGFNYKALLDSIEPI